MNRRKLSLFLSVLLVASIFVPVFIHPAYASWYDPGWQYRKSITIDHTKVSADLTGFPVLISVTDSDLALKAQSNGYDILFTDSSGSIRLSHEIESYDSGDLVAWVNVPSLSSSVDTLLYMYYGNGGAGDQQDPAGVWDSSFMMVQHLSETSGTHYDSTSHDNDGTATGGLSQGAPGKIDGADNFDGIDDRIDVAHDNSMNFGTGDFAISLWTKYPSTNDDSDFIRKGNINTSPEANYKLELVNNAISGVLQGSNPGGGGTVTTSTSYGDDNWHCVVFMRNAGAISLYVDGALKATQGGAGIDLTNTSNTAIGGKNPPPAEDFFQGFIDEVRVQNVALSEDWIVASYNSMNNPSSFVAFGSEELSSGTTYTVTFHTDPSGTITADGVSKSDGDTGIYGEGSNVHVIAYAPGGYAFSSWETIGGVSVQSGDSFVVLFLGMDGADGSTSFSDSSASDHVMTANENAQVDTAQSKFGGASGLLAHSTADYISTPDSADWAFGTGDFTIDFWVRFNTLPLIGNQYGICGQRTGGDQNNFYYFALRNTAGSYRWVMDDKVDGAYGPTIFADTSVSTGTWYHVAFVRSVDDWYIFQDGVSLSATISNPAAGMGDFGGTFNVGQGFGLWWDMLDGWLDEFRVSKGLARWTSNFTPPSVSQEPTAPYDTYMTVSGTGTLTAHFTLQSSAVILNAISPQYYQRGDTVYYSGTVTIGGLPAPDGTDVGIVVEDSLGVEIFTDQKTTTGGAFSGDFVIGASGAEGLWTLTASAGAGHDSETFHLGGYGMLRVYSSPAVPTTVFVDNIARDDWGLNWVKLEPGSYTVHFTDVPGFATPPDQAVTVSLGETTTVAGVFMQLGYLHVVTNPALPATISVDGVARNDWGLWVPLTPGSHTVHFGDVAGYTAPADQQATVVAGSTVTVTGDYVVGVNPGPTGFGMLRVTTDPAVGSTIYVDNVAMDDWGLNWVKLAPGEYTVHFSDMPGYATPPNQTVTVTLGETTDVTGSFTQLGYLHVTTNPAVPGTIYVDGVAMDDWGVWVSLAPGTYTVSFGDVPGYSKPADQVVIVAAGATTTVTGEYT